MIETYDNSALNIIVWNIAKEYLIFYNGKSSVFFGLETFDGNSSPIDHRNTKISPFNVSRYDNFTGWQENAV
ncbi:hypothetical protein C1646_751029 [Rhizophagus diaphanus]|nr:hypothetical protein C1646_751029 [Rhizophagus diaphanus] [Rhizophagus sp. MUCL 43196]